MHLSHTNTIYLDCEKHGSKHICRLFNLLTFTIVPLPDFLKIPLRFTITRRSLRLARTRNLKEHEGERESDRSKGRKAEKSKFLEIPRMQRHEEGSCRRRRMQPRDARFGATDEYALYETPDHLDEIILSLSGEMITAFPPADVGTKRAFYPADAFHDLAVSPRGSCNFPGCSESLSA